MVRLIPRLNHSRPWNVRYVFTVNLSLSLTLVCWIEIIAVAAFSVSDDVLRKKQRIFFSVSGIKRSNHPDRWQMGLNPIKLSRFEHCKTVLFFVCPEFMQRSGSGLCVSVCVCVRLCVSESVKCNWECAWGKCCNTACRESGVATRHGIGLPQTRDGRKVRCT